MQTAKLGIDVDASQVTNATEALNTMAVAAERASKALDELAGKAHGGIKINVVGNLATVEIDPPSA